MVALAAVGAVMGSRRTLSILYGSETGTAESIAVRLYRESKRYHFDSRVFPMDAYPAAEIVQVFVATPLKSGFLGLLSTFRYLLWLSWKDFCP